MALLMLFALIAGAGTALSPCVLPVLPALLGAGLTGGRRRPVGIALGLAATFTVTIVGLASVIDGVGLGPGLTRTLAVVVLIGFGIVVAVPSLAARLEAPLARLSRLGPRTRGDGFASGLLVGAALGFVYAPCAGPILAAVIAVGAASSRTVPVGLAFALGSAIVLLALSLGGRALAERVRATGRGPACSARWPPSSSSPAWPWRRTSTCASSRPSPTTCPPRSSTRRTASRPRTPSPAGSTTCAVRRASRSPAPGARASRARLPRLGAAPDFTGNQRWFNTPGGQPLSLRSLRGKVVLVDFWTYTCINCLRTLPYLEAWDARYRRDGLVIVGVHSPEFPFEREAGNVARAIRREGIRYPVAQDNKLATWSAWGNQYWPADYLVDARGQVRDAHFGEGDYDRTEMDIRALLQGGRPRQPGRDGRPQGRDPPDARGDARDLPGPGARRALRPAAAARHAHLRAGAQARDQPLRAVGHLGRERRRRDGGRRRGHPRRDRRQGRLPGPQPAAGRAGDVRVLLDGRPIADDRAGADVHHGVVRVDRQRLYHLVSAPTGEHHALTLRVAPGVQAYAFTFG